ncbi:ATP-binding protein [Methanoregula sp.]|uniref:ATP-binding protein n=1 Tax=Methanoregula sp. TaxID=2052170 RepID=UPI00262D7F03|nr:ATP-binding protein [Methanoregula sp.]
MDRGSLTLTPLTELLTSMNPWWVGRDFEIGKPRPAYLAKIQRYLDTREIIVLSGVRRAGKTTLLYQTIHHLIADRDIPPRNILFVKCDEEGIASAGHTVSAIVDTYRKEVSVEGTIYLVFDEIQAIKNWEQTIKSFYDKKQYRIIISGSSSYLLDSQVATLLSGRYLTVTVFPLDFREYLAFSGQDVPADPIDLASRKYEIITLLKRYLREGGFPGVALQADERTRLDQLKAYYDSIVYRDIVRVNEVRNQKALAAVLHYLFTNIASPYSYRRLSETFGINIATLQDYIRFADMARILREIQIFSYSLQTQARANKKIYCIDNGLRNAVSFRFSEDEGKLAENLVFLELIKSDADLFYWKNNHEMDFVMKNPDTSLTAINVCYTDSIPGREADALQEFSELFAGKVRERIILTRDKEGEENRIVYTPLWKWLLGRG